MKIEQFRFGHNKKREPIKRCVNCGKMLGRKGRPNYSGYCGICIAYKLTAKNSKKLKLREKKWQK